MASPHTPAPWHMEVYLNERDETLPPSIVGLDDNYPVAVCCGIDEETDQANGKLIAAAPELLEAPCAKASRAHSPPTATPPS